jgi:hypothetical protein
VAKLAPQKRQELAAAGQKLLGPGGQRFAQRMASFSKVIPLGTGAQHVDPGSGVTVGTDTGYLISGHTRPSGFSFSYAGPDQDKANWLQFVWREILVSQPGRPDNMPLDKPLATTGGSYRLTLDRAAPVYNTDAGSKNPPFYPTVNATGEAATMYDHPGALDKLVHEQFDLGARRVISRAHFDSFLVVDDAVRYHVKLDIEWSFARPRDTPRVYTIGASKAATELPALIRARLHEQFPAFKHIT